MIRTKESVCLGRAVPARGFANTPVGMFVKPCELQLSRGASVRHRRLATDGSHFLWSFSLQRKPRLTRGNLKADKAHSRS